MVELGDGTVLVVGNDHACAPGPAWEGSEIVERYDAVHDRWTDAASLNKPRKGGVTLPLSGGRAFVIGGVNTEGLPFSSTKIFDPTASSWANGPLLTVARAAPVAVALPNGRLLVVSGFDAEFSAEMYDPPTATWSLVPVPKELVGVYSLLALSDGRVLVSADPRGEIDEWPTPLVFDPVRGSWLPVSGAPGLGATIVAVSGGRAVAVGGGDGGTSVGGIGASVADVAVFDGASLRWAQATAMSVARESAQVTALRDGRVLVAGGWKRASSDARPEVLTSTEIFDPRTARWSTGPELTEPRAGGRAVELRDGSVLVLGGYALADAYHDTPFCPPSLTSVERMSPEPPTR